MMGWHVGNGMGWGGVVYMPIIFILIVVCGVMIVRWSLRPGGGEASALEILKRRYARGELSKEQFKEMKKDLQ